MSEWIERLTAWAAAGLGLPIIFGVEYDNRQVALGFAVLIAVVLGIAELTIRVMINVIRKRQYRDGESALDVDAEQVTGLRSTNGAVTKCLTPANVHVGSSLATSIAVGN